MTDFLRAFGPGWEKWGYLCGCGGAACGNGRDEKISGGGGLSISGVGGNDMGRSRMHQHVPPAFLYKKNVGVPGVAFVGVAGRSGA